MNSEDTFTRINEIEKQIDISNYIIDDVNIWPIIRLHIDIQMIHLSKNQQGIK